MKKRKLTHEQFIAALRIYRERNCADCGWLTAALHWWCTNQKAIDARGTTFPGICHCPWWKPDRDYIRKQLRELSPSQKTTNAFPHSRINALKSPRQSKTCGDFWS